jgi:methyl-accepting chemotaxis protein
MTALYPVGKTGWLLGVVVPVAATVSVSHMIELMIGVLIAGVVVVACWQRLAWPACCPV